MTFTELVQDTREAQAPTDLEVLEAWADTLESINELEHKLEAIEAELKHRGYSI